jgi:hypothetical protein
MNTHLWIVSIIFTTSLFAFGADTAEGSWETQVDREGTRSMRLVLDVAPDRITWSTECILDDGLIVSDAVGTVRKFQRTGAPR